MDSTTKYILNYVITTVNFNGRELYPQVIYWEFPTNEYASRTEQKSHFYFCCHRLKWIIVKISSI